MGLSRSPIKTAVIFPLTQGLFFEHLKGKGERGSTYTLRFDMYRNFIEGNPRQSAVRQPKCDASALVIGPFLLAAS
jgi:hypothetical protein